MKLFECYDGSLINPFQVCSFSTEGSSVTILFAKSMKAYSMENSEAAKKEKERFKYHFEVQLKL